MRVLVVEDERKSRTRFAKASKVSGTRLSSKGQVRAHTCTTGARVPGLTFEIPEKNRWAFVAQLDPVHRATV